MIHDPYLVWSNDHRAWWRPARCGYTTDVRAAGIYTKEEAVEISGKGRYGWSDPKRVPDELAIPISALPETILAALPNGERS